MTRRPAYLVLLLIVALFAGLKANGQAVYAGKGPGGYISLGATVSGYNSDYGKQRLIGPAVYLDANLYRRIGVEGEFRNLRYHAQEDLRQSTYLVGPRISTHTRAFRPYAKFLVGRGTMTFPFRYARGSYFVAAPGAGLDVRLGQSRVLVRVVDVEYQFWPDFTFGPMHPWGISTGLSVRLF